MIHLTIHTFDTAGLFSCNWFAESARVWVSNIRRKSTSGGNAQPYARSKLKARTGGGKGRHLSPRLVQKIDELRRWKVKVMMKKKKKKRNSIRRRIMSYLDGKWNLRHFLDTYVRLVPQIPVDQSPMGRVRRGMSQAGETASHQFVFSFTE